MNSPRDSKRYTDKQIQAIMHAWLMDGKARADIVRLAATGELGDLPAFHIDERYIYQLTANNRDQFEAENPEALARTTYRDLAQAHRLNLQALRALAKTDADPTERSRVAKAVAETAKALNATNKPTRIKPQANEPETPTTPPIDPTLQSLLGLAPKPTAQGRKTGSLSHARNDAAPSTAA